MISTVTRKASQWSVGLIAGLVSIVLSIIATGLIAYRNTSSLHHSAETIRDTHRVLLALTDLLSMLKDAESGQRGYVLTGSDRYLEPYRVAVGLIDNKLLELRQLTEDNPDHLRELPGLEAATKSKVLELEETVTARRDKGFDAAMEIVSTNRGKADMETIRRHIEAMQVTERAVRNQRVAEIERAFVNALGSVIVATLAGLLLSGIVTYLLRQAMSARAQQEWLQATHIKVSQGITGEQRMEHLAGNILQLLVSELDAVAGAFFVANGVKFERVGTYGVPETSGVPKVIEPGDGLVSDAARSRKPLVVRDVPSGYFVFGSALGHSAPKHLLIVPLPDEDRVAGVLELGFSDEISAEMLELFERIAEPIAIAIRSVHYRAHLQNLLEETQRQAEELQAQGEELRVSNEELEEQSRALRESQARLESQQAELEQTNSQLEEQAQLLETQRDEVGRAKQEVELQAQQLEQASRYKSEFLANMSHELRTPLNSSLILAKLLADNSQGNLTSEQVQYAETIQTAGNDLLALINDILDLSKIEAGHMEIRPEPFALSPLLNDLRRVFEPLAVQKQLEFQVEIENACPASLTTDRLRLEQILRNLASNAVKFTDHGFVRIKVSRIDESHVEFAVHDTGIGIEPSQQQLIFEAFRQADATTSRKYGGTGLGLSIAREFSRLLGGELRLDSTPGQGSTFRLMIPIHFDETLVRTPAAHPATVVSAPKVLERTTLETPSTTLDPGEINTPVIVDDDRGRLTTERRVLLVVEDDRSFARVLYDLAHELKFQCLIANTAESGFATAVQYLPDAVVLDIGLPDHTGLWVLDRLKHDRRTRHIPVHVVSANDYSQAARTLGAVGHLIKPVRREDLAGAIRQLEARLSQRVGHVLIVEDDAVQLDSLRRLLGSQQVETAGARTAAECLEQLKKTTFDCMVLDLSLPDASGYSLLETLDREDAYSFPPVIVYTGRDLSADEEQKLRRYSKSIIIKGAKSPERLLDEVTLFLHRVVSELPVEQQRMLEKARHRDATIEGRRILVVEDDVRNVFALTSILEPSGAVVKIARNGREALEQLESAQSTDGENIDLVLMDVMMPEMDGLTAIREIRRRPEWRKLPVIMLTAKAMKDDQENCLAAGANDYMAKPIDVEKLLSLVRVWMPR